MPLGIIFASRHVFCTIITLLNAWPQMFWPNLIMKLSIVLSTITLARTVTEALGDKTKRTTNAMPYPYTVSKEEQNRIKSLYGAAQFHATTQAVIGDAT